MKISEVQIGHKFQHGLRGDGIIINKTPRTLTAKFKHSTRNGK